MHCVKNKFRRNWVWNQDEGRNRFQRPATMHIRLAPNYYMYYEVILKETFKQQAGEAEQTIPLVC